MPYTIPCEPDGPFAHQDPLLLQQYERTGRFLETLIIDDPVYTDEELTAIGFLDARFIGERGVSIIRQFNAGADPEELMMAWRSELAAPPPT